MLLKLSIQNFAIIDELTTEFQPRLNTITGETGAGKSILLGALGLVLGNRADSAVLMNKEKKCVVEVFFSATSNSKVKEWLLLNEMDEDDTLILRREISANGKSRAFVNDSPVNLTQLKELTSLLVDLHQQFDTLELAEEEFQREIIDALAGCIKEVRQYHSNFLQFAKMQKELLAMKDLQHQKKKEQDYKQFLLDELDQASLKENELEQLDEELTLLSNAGAISTVLNDAVQFLKEGDAPIVQQLKSVLQRLQQFKEINNDLSSVTERLQSAQIELTDIAAELDHLQNRISIDETRMQTINDRLGIGYKLQKKHGVNSTNALLQIQSQLEEEVQVIINMDQAIAEQEKEIAELQKQLEKQAAAIHLQRKKQITPFTEKVNALLVRVGMPNARLKTELIETGLNAFGKDEVIFLFDANKSNRFEKISKVASGGELSRLMLCIKSLVAASIDLPTMLFDEIDTGISGEAARQVGMLLKELSANHQVITITHLPQIASKASAHYFVYKQEENSVIKTKIRLLNKEEQIETIARMLSGEKLTESSLLTAKEMVAG